MGAWGWRELADNIYLVGIVKQHQFNEDDSDWEVKIDPDPGYRHLLTNPFSTAVNGNKLISCEVRPGGHVANRGNEEKLWGSLLNRRVIVFGTWVIDKSHTSGGSSNYLPDLTNLLPDFLHNVMPPTLDEYLGKTEIHPVLFLVHFINQEAHSITKIEIFVFSDHYVFQAYPPRPFSPPHSNEDRTVIFKVYFPQPLIDVVQPLISVVHLYDASSKYSFERQEEDKKFYLKVYIESGEPADQGYFHSIIELWATQVFPVVQRPAKISVLSTRADGKIFNNVWDQSINEGMWQGWTELPSLPVISCSPIWSVARDSAKTDVFTIGSDGLVYTSALDQNTVDQKWIDWRSLPAISASHGSTVYAVSRDSSKIDVFAIGSDATVYNAAWDQNFEPEHWRGWWALPPVAVSLNAGLSIVTRDATKMDVFVVSTDNNIYNAAWDQNFEPEHWRGWWALPPIAAVPGSPVCAVCRDPTKMDVFIVGVDSNVYTAAWDQNDGNPQWKGWWALPFLSVVAGCPIFAVARDPAKLDVFVIGADGNVYNAAWDQNFEPEHWRGWWALPPVPAVPGSPVYVVSRDPTKMDVFIVGVDSNVYTAAWDQNDGNSQWNGWWKLEWS